MTTIARSDTGITVKGHAGYAPIGQDIVCAAISTLTQGLIKSINELTEDKITIHSLSPGTVDISYRDLSRDAQLLVNSFFVGVKMVADAYPDYVRIV